MNQIAAQVSVDSQLRPYRSGDSRWVTPAAPCASPESRERRPDSPATRGGRGLAHCEAAALAADLSHLPGEPARGRIKNVSSDAAPNTKIVSIFQVAADGEVELACANSRIDRGSRRPILSRLSSRRLTPIRLAMMNETTRKE